MESTTETPPETETSAARGDGQSHQSASSQFQLDQHHDTSWWVGSQAVNWWAVHEFVAVRIETVGPFPMVGTPAWCDLPDDDPVKWAALLDAAQHWALRVNTCQEAMAEASKTISDAVDWPRVAREFQQRSEFYAEKPYLRRVIPR
jgi:hypothetical protein